MFVHIITALGWAGAFAGILAYSMVSRGKWVAASFTFQLTNIAAAMAMFAVAAINGVWPSAAANVAWLGIGVISTFRIMKERGYSLSLKSFSRSLPHRALSVFEVSSASANAWSQVGGQGGPLGYGSHSRLAA